jgi:putative ABC transport system substrate-binding protein
MQRLPPDQSTLSRRHFVQSAGLAGVGLLAGCGRLPGQAQPSRTYRVACLGPSPPGTGEGEAFLDGLRGYGYQEGRNLLVEARSTRDMDDAPRQFASELLAWQPDVFFTGGTIATRLAMEAAPTIPIVFVQVNDPVRQGLVASLARPGGNATGLTQLSSQLSTKRMELLRDMRGGLARVAVLVNAMNPGNALDWDQMREAAAVSGIEAQRLDVSSAADLAGTVGAAIEGGAEGLILAADPFLMRGVRDLAADGLAHRLPVIAPYRPAAEAGALFAYGPNGAAMYRRAAYYVDRILKGAKPADLPVEQPTNFEFVINVQTARALGLTIPQHVLLQATEIIQ